MIYSLLWPCKVGTILGTPYIYRMSHKKLILFEKITKSANFCFWQLNYCPSCSIADILIGFRISKFLSWAAWFWSTWKFSFVYQASSFVTNMRKNYHCKLEGLWKISILWLSGKLYDVAYDVNLVCWKYLEIRFF